MVERTDCAIGGVISSFKFMVTIRQIADQFAGLETMFPVLYSNICVYIVHMYTALYSKCCLFYTCKLWFQVWLHPLHPYDHLYRIVLEII